VPLRLDQETARAAAATDLTDTKTPPVVGTDGADDGTTTETKMETNAKDFNPLDDGEDEAAFFAPATSGPPCRFYLGCDQIATEEGLCPFHFDAMERSEHSENQRLFDAGLLPDAERAA
jgi:hypothetical protein